MLKTTQGSFRNLANNPCTPNGSFGILKPRLEYIILNIAIKIVATKVSPTRLWLDDLVTQIATCAPDDIKYLMFY